jgi:hypothetical protein
MAAPPEEVCEMLVSACRRAAALCAAILGALVFIAGPAPALAATTAPEIEGVVGTDSGLWVKGNNPSGPWLGLGGFLIAAPGGASVPDTVGGGPGTPFWVVTGGDHNLWTFSQQTGWERLSIFTAYCIDNPAAVIVRAHAAGAFLLTVACQGADHALWFAQTQVGSLLGPLNLVWQSLGGVLVSGPAVAPVDPLHQTVDGELTFFGNGTDGHVWTRTFATGWTQTPWGCIGHPAAAATLSTQIPISGQVTVFGCQGLDHSLWMARNFGDGRGWIDTQSLGGVLVNGPGVAVGPSTATFFVEGTDTASWHRTITHGGNVFSWTTDGGGLQYGASAVALLFASDNP